MCLTLQDLNLSYYNAITENAKVKEQLASNLCLIIKTGEKLISLDFSNMQLPDQINLRIAQAVADMSPSIQVFQISHNSTNTPVENSEHVYHDNESAKEIFKTFSIPWKDPIS